MGIAHGGAAPGVANPDVAGRSRGDGDAPELAQVLGITDDRIPGLARASGRHLAPRLR